MRAAYSALEEADKMSTEAINRVKETTSAIRAEASLARERKVAYCCTVS